MFIMFSVHFWWSQSIDEIRPRYIQEIGARKVQHFSASPFFWSTLKIMLRILVFSFQYYEFKLFQCQLHTTWKEAYRVTILFVGILKEFNFWWWVDKFDINSCLLWCFFLSFFVILVIFCPFFKQFETPSGSHWQNDVSWHGILGLWKCIFVGSESCRLDD